MSLLSHVVLALTLVGPPQETPPRGTPSQPARALHLTGPYSEMTVGDAEVWIVGAPPWESQHGPDGDELMPWIRRVGRHTRSDGEGRVELLPGERPLVVHAETAKLVTLLPTASSDITDGPWQALVSDARGDVWIRMTPKGPVEVRVVDAAGRPVADQVVRIPVEALHGPHYDESLTSARTDEDGIAHLAWAGAVSTGYDWRDALREGATVGVELPLQTAVRTWVASGERGLLQLPHTVDLVVHCPVGGLIELERARRPNDSFPAFAGRLGHPPPILDRLGRFQDGMVVRDVPVTAPFTVRIRVSGDRTVERAIDPAECAGLTELHVELAAPEGAPPPGASALVLSGRLVDVDGLPLAGGRLGVSFGDQALDAGGRFSELRARAGSEKKIMARGRGYAPYYRYTARVPADAVGPEVDLGTLYPERERALAAGRVVDESGRPVAGATVRIFDPESKNRGFSRFVSTDARGRFFQSWREGAAQPQRLHLTAAEGGRCARGSEIVPGDAEVELTLLAGGVVRATLALEENVPTANLVAELEGPLKDRSAMEPRRRLPFGAGGVEFSALPEGTYALGIYALGTERPVAYVESLQVVPGNVWDRDLTDEEDPTWRLAIADLTVVDANGAPVGDAQAWLGSTLDYAFDRYAAVPSVEEGRLRLALHPGVALGTETARATITAPGHRSRDVVLVPGEQQVALSPPSTLAIHFGDTLARERASATIHLFQWSDLRGLVRVTPASGSPQTGVMTFAVEDPGPYEPRWVEGARSWSIRDPSRTDPGGYVQWLQVPDEGLELRLGE